MLSEQEAKKRIQIALNNANEYIKNENLYAQNFNKERIEECLRQRGEYLGLSQNIYWLKGLSEDSFNSFVSSFESSFGSSLESSFVSSLVSSYLLTWWDSKYLAANDNSLKEYSKFMKEAIQNGLGFICDFEKGVIVIPMPLFRKNAERQLHSNALPAVEWRDGSKEYYLNGVKFPQELWSKIISGNMLFEDILKIEDVDQRTQAMKYGDPYKFLDLAKAVKLDERIKFAEDKPILYQLYRIPQGDIFSQDAYFIIKECPSTGKKYMEGVEKCNNVAEALAWQMSNGEWTTTPDVWEKLILLKDET